MDPVTGIGLAAAVFQLIDVSTKITKRLMEFSPADIENGPPKSFKNITTVLPLITEGLRNIEKYVHHLAVQPQQALHNVVQKCLKNIEELNRILDKALPSSDASSWEKTRKALASLRYDKQVEEISQTMDHCMKALSFYQLSGITQSHKVEQPPLHQKVHWIVPFDKNEAFVERSAVFTEIEKTFKVKEGVQPKAALHGLGGIGIFWCNAATVARFEQSLGRIAVGCGLVSEGKTEIDTPEIVQQWLEFQHESPWLMIIDNIDDKEVFFKAKMRSGKTVSECIPTCAHGFLLYTTRSREVAFDVLKQAHPIMMKEMSREEGLNLARKRLPANTPENLIIQLLETLEFIPLAITQASAFIAKRGKTVQYYLEQYQKSDTMRTKLLSYEFSDHGRQFNSMESLAKTWMISFQIIQESNPRAADLLCLMSFFQHHGIPAILLRREDVDESDFEDAIALLEAFAFIDSDATDAIFRMHRLVQLATRWWLGKEGPSESEKWTLAALKSVATKFPHLTAISSPNMEYFLRCETLLPHAEQALQSEFEHPSQEVDLARARLLHSTGAYLLQLNSYTEARPRFKHSKELNLKHLGEGHIATMDSTNGAASVATYLQDLEGVPMFERLLELQECVLGDDNHRTIDTMSALAEAISLTGDHQKSENMQREALARSLGAFSTHHICTLNCKARLAKIYYMQGKMADAEILIRETYVTELQMFGPTHRRFLRAENDLAYVLSLRKETYDESYNLLNNNIRTAGDILGYDHPRALGPARDLAMLLEKMGKWVELRTFCKWTLENIENGPRMNSVVAQRMKRGFEQRLESVEYGPSF